MVASGVRARSGSRRSSAACHAATGGNPLFVRALVAALHGEGVEPTAENARRVREIGPEPVARAVTLRLSRLPEEARRFATAAAVLGDGAELRDVGRARRARGPPPILARRDLARPGRPAARDDADSRVRPPGRASRGLRVDRAGAAAARPPPRRGAARHRRQQSPSGSPRTSTWCRPRATRSWSRRCAWPPTARSSAGRPRSRFATFGARWPSRRRQRRGSTRSPSSAWRSSAWTSLAAAEHLQEALSATEEPLRHARLALQARPLAVPPQPRAGGCVGLQAGDRTARRARSRSCGRCWRRS